MSGSADISKLIGGLGALRQRALAAAAAGMDEAGEHVIGVSQTLCPVKTGALAASGTTEPAVVRGNNVTKTIGHGVSYAAAVHERLDSHHPQGQAKFLERAIRENASRVSELVAERVRAVKR